MITIEEIKSILNKKFINNYQTITRVSERTDHNEDKISMLESEFKIFNYDDGILKIINKQKNQEPICAVDAIDIQEDIIYFIEFKDGAVFGAKPKDKYQLRLKMIESIFQLLDVLGLPLNKFKEFLDLKKVFILVYNEDNAYKGIYPEEKELRYNEYKRRLEKYKETQIYSDVKLYNKEKFEEKYINKYSYI
ncbi:hypothetical protein KST83_02120 [Fusobacterium nucleatum]|uniref:Uncharacterized protein n=1 Tax=Fusobacterium nucleatum subsp. polymorphum TaxID=76857 RepID=A0A2C6AV76_FUSNP|nr:hypothetical protein [Fusobacterium polymorphum]PHH95912.1 hypothetical protein CA840_00095 [Fusobacterium polymorphum]